MNALNASPWRPSKRFNNNFPIKKTISAFLFDKHLKVPKCHNSLWPMCTDCVHAAGSDSERMQIECKSMHFSGKETRQKCLSSNITECLQCSWANYTAYRPLWPKRWTGENDFHRATYANHAISNISIKTKKRKLGTRWAFLGGRRLQQDGWLNFCNETVRQQDSCTKNVGQRDSLATRLLQQGQRDGSNDTVPMRLFQWSCLKRLQRDCYA